MSEFNLIDEKWIPVRFSDGIRDELGIRDTLLRSGEIAAIEDPSPLVVAALQRFLLAVLYRALEGPTDIGQAKKLFKDGMPKGKITDYLENWRDRFWLFDEKYPFGQVPEFKPKKWQPWQKMAAERNAGNARVLFDHLDNNGSGFISLGLSARLLLAVQTFDLAVAKSEFTQPLDAPSARAVFSLVMGKTLHETLCFNLKYQPQHIGKNDSALWEREPEPEVNLKQGASREISGYADLYTWPSRSIIFQKSKVDGIQWLGFASGVRKKDNNLFIDPMLCYQKSQKVGLVPIKFEEDKNFWRDFYSLLPGAEGQMPLVIENAIALCRTVKGEWPQGLLICGQKTKSGQAKVDFWRMEFFKLPTALTNDRSAVSLIRELLGEVELAGKVLENFLRTIGESQITRGERELMPDKWVAGKFKPGDVTKYVMSTDALPLYWSNLEASFHGILDLFDIGQNSDEIRCQWLKYVRSALQRAWGQHQASVVTGDAWSIRALVKAEGAMRRKIYELNQEIKQLEPQEEPV